MRARNIVGRKVVRVLQERRQTDYGKMVWDIQGFVLDNGKVVYFNVVELPDDYAVEAGVVKS